MDISTSGAYIDESFFNYVRRVRATEVPQEPVSLDGRDIQITGTSTEVYREQHTFSPPYFGEEVTLRLPAHHKLVTVAFEHPGSRPQSVSLSLNGDALYERQAKYTQPDALDPAFLVSEYGGYPTPERWNAHYAGNYMGALGVTEFVAKSLNRVHGMRTDTSEIKRLQRAWQRVSPAKMHPDIAVLLPQKTR
ncbi:MAG: hypothetical protein ACR2LN_03350 [Candidatus Levyibacteriota bacterium]